MGSRSEEAVKRKQQRTREAVVLAVLACLLLSGCATWSTARQCSVGVMFFGPIPVPTASCELIFGPEEDEGV
jgi:hypothetical protein